VIGYDDDANTYAGKGAVWLSNSWGTDWGIPCGPFPQYGRGFFLMPYAVLDDRDLSDDFWAITIPPFPQE
jgi:C1A family cysteine protease